MDRRILIDTNILCRHALQDHADHSPRANALFLRLARGEEYVFCPVTSVFEAIHILHLRNKVPRDETTAYFEEIFSYVGFEMEHKEAIRHAMRFWGQHPKLDFADCYHLSLSKELGMKEIYSFDKRMSQYPGVERIEPE